MFDFFKKSSKKKEETKPKVLPFSEERFNASLTVLLLKHKAGRYDTDQAIKIIHNLIKLFKR